ncbi:MAG TPA: hypothetical protein VF064_07060 [Pyrinomonadaceae bacterium]
MGTCAFCGGRADGKRKLTLYSGHIEVSRSGETKTTTLSDIQRHELFVCDSCRQRRVVASLLAVAACCLWLGWFGWATTRREFPLFEFLIVTGTVVGAFAAILVRRFRQKAYLTRRIRDERGDQSFDIVDGADQLSLGNVLEAMSATQRSATVRRKDGYSYGAGQSDLRYELENYSAANGFPVAHVADAVCRCGGRTFSLALDAEARVALRVCGKCGDEHSIGDSAERGAADAAASCECVCGKTQFEITLGVALDEGAEDALWLYIACRCPGCELMAVYADWKTESIGYKELLARA